MFSEGGCTLRTGRHLLIMVVLMLASISGTVRNPGEDTGTVSALSTDCVGLILRIGTCISGAAELITLTSLTSADMCFGALGVSE